MFKGALGFYLIVFSTIEFFGCRAEILAEKIESVVKGQYSPIRHSKIRGRSIKSQKEILEIFEKIF